MLFKILVLLQLWLVLCQAEHIPRSKSQTHARIKFAASDKFPVCKCQGGKCELIQKAAEEACRVLMERFRFYVYPTGYMALCEFEPKSCEELEGDKPKFNHIIITYDTYYLRTSPFNSEILTPARAVTELFQRDTLFPHPLFENRALEWNVTMGYSGMPVEFDGALRLPASGYQRLQLCYDRCCHNFYKCLCSNFEKALMDVVPDKAKHLIGCHIRNVYKWKGELRASWSMMFFYDPLVTHGIIKSTKDLKNFVTKIKTDLKPPKILKNFVITGVKPLDFCEIRATAMTPIKYHEYMDDPSTFPYRINSQMLYKDLFKQFMLGEEKYPSCIRNIFEMTFQNVSGSVQAETKLWVSMTCYKRKGFKDCHQVEKDIIQMWDRGSQRWYNFWTPKYTFKLYHINGALEI